MSKALKIAILEYNITQIRFARLLNLSEAQLCRYVTGRSLPPQALQERMAVLLGKPIWILFPKGGAR